MTTPHVPTADERQRDAELVRCRILMNALWAIAHERGIPAGAYGPFTGSPDDAKRARLEREDEEANMTDLLSRAPDCADDTQVDGAA